MVFGRGIYFSEVPTVSLIYGNTLILCRVVLGACQNFTPVAGHRVLTFSGLIFHPTFFCQAQSNTGAALANMKRLFFKSGFKTKKPERSYFFSK